MAQGLWQKMLRLINHIVFESIDHAPPSVPNSSHSTQLYFFEDNVAVFQVFHKVRSPHHRHVTRTHRVDLDWLFGVYWDQSIWIKYVRTTDRWEDNLTKRMFTTK